MCYIRRPKGVVKFRIGGSRLFVIRRLHLAIYFFVLVGSIPAQSQEPDRLLKTVSLDTKISVAAFSPNGELVATVDRTSTTSGKSAIKVWEVANGELRFVTDDYPIYSVTFSSDGEMLAAACRDGVRLFGLDGRLIRTLAGNQIFAVAFDSLDKTLAAGGAEGEVQLWHVAGRTLLSKFSLNKQITSLAFSPDGKFLAAGASADPTPITIWRLRDRKELTSLSGHPSGVLSLTFDSKGETLASGGSDGQAVMWRLRNGEQVNNRGFAASKGPIHSVDFSPDNQWIAFDADNNILIFKQKTLQQLVLKGHTRQIVQLQYSLDGKTLFSASEDNTVRTWQVN